MADPILVDVECIRATTADYEYFEEGRTYIVDMAWAKKRDIWRYFRPLREVSKNEADDRIFDQILPDREAKAKADAEINEEAEARLREQKLDPIKSYAAGKTKAKKKAKAAGKK